MPPWRKWVGGGRGGGGPIKKTAASSSSYFFLFGEIVSGSSTSFYWITLSPPLSSVLELAISPVVQGWQRRRNDFSQMRFTITSFLPSLFRGNWVLQTPKKEQDILEKKRRSKQERPRGNRETRKFGEENAFQKRRGKKETFLHMLQPRLFPPFKKWRKNPFPFPFCEGNFGKYACVRPNKEMTIHPWRRGTKFRIPPFTHWYAGKRKFKRFFHFFFIAKVRENGRGTRILELGKRIGRIPTRGRRYKISPEAFFLTTQESILMQFRFYRTKKKRKSPTKGSPKKVRKFKINRHAISCGKTG